MEEMAEQRFGVGFDLTNDAAILAIHGAAAVQGPYVVAWKGVGPEERFAVVALAWDDRPVLGVRWFFGGVGFPFAFGNPSWFVIPDPLAESIVNRLAGLEGFAPTEARRDIRKAALEAFLKGVVTGETLAACW